MKKLVFLVSFFIFILFPHETSAVSISINNSPTSISSQEFNVDVSVSGAGDGTNYLRVDLYKEGTSNYFGETYTGSMWYGGSSGTSYFPIEIQNASASATLQARMGNPNTTDYPGPGEYKLKIRRYTSSGSAASNDVQTPATLQISYVTPSPSPTASPTAQPTQSLTPTPTPTKSPSPIPSKSPTPKPKLSPTATPEVLGEEISPLPSRTPQPSATSLELGFVEKKKFPFFPLILILLGVSMVGFAVYNLVRAKKSPVQS